MQSLSREVGTLPENTASDGIWESVGTDTWSVVWAFAWDSAEFIPEDAVGFDMKEIRNAIVE